MLQVEVDGRGPRLILVHGFAQTARCWGPVAADLAADHEVVRVDAPGHGASATVRAGLTDGGRLVADVGGEGTYIGYSMGGRFVLHAALAAPERVRGLVLIGAAGGIEDTAARAARREQDAQLARRLEAEGVEAFLDDWLARPLFSGLGPAAQFRAERLTNTVEGLAHSLRQAGTGSQEPLWDRLASLAMPVLAVAGADDAKFRAEAERLAATIGPNAEVALVPAAGHAAHLEQPQACLALLRPWLAQRGL